ncbi:hypothetical protein HY251_00735 [bacterium]|nr:hypothetical protein [bacterium]
MTCVEIRSLLPFRPLEVLEEDEAEGVSAHLASCQACSKLAQTYDGAFETLREPTEDDAMPATKGDFAAGPLPEKVFEKIVARIASPEAPSAGVATTPDLSIALVCSFCHDVLARDQTCYCASCLAPHHDDCFRSHGRCSAYGCEETRTVRPQLERASASAAPARSRGPRRSRIIALGTVLVLGGAAAAASSYLSKPMTVENKAAPTAMPPAAATPPTTTTRVAFTSQELKDVPVQEALDFFAKNSNDVVADPSVRGRVSVRVEGPNDWPAALESVARQLKCRVLPVGYGMRALVPMADTDWDTAKGDVRTLLKDLCSKSGKNVIVAPDVYGTMRGNLRGLPWRRAFDTIVSTCDLYCGEYDGIVVVAAHELRGARSFDADEANVRPRDGTPDATVDLTLKDARVDEAILALAKVAHVTVVGAIPPSEARVAFSVHDVSWFDLLNYLAWTGNYRIVQPSPTEISLEPRRPHDSKVEPSLHCVRASAAELVQVLASRAGKNFVISPEVRARILDVDLVGFGYEAALHAIADAYGFKFDETAGVLTVTLNKEAKVAQSSYGSGLVARIDYGEAVQAYVGVVQTILHVPGDPSACEVLIDSRGDGQEAHGVGELLELKTNSLKGGVTQVGSCKAKITAIRERSIELEIDGTWKAEMFLGKF